MTIRIDLPLPDLALTLVGDEDITTTHTAELFGNRKTVLFAVPGAFTPTCSERHFPGYIEQLGQFELRDIHVVGLAVNDAFVLQAWRHSLSVPEDLKLIADGNAEFVRALGLQMDAAAFGMGIRSQRFALYAENAVVRALFIEEPGQFKVSAAEYVLQHID